MNVTIAVIWTVGRVACVTLRTGISAGLSVIPIPIFVPMSLLWMVEHTVMLFYLLHQHQRVSLIIVCMFSSSFFFSGQAMRANQRCDLYCGENDDYVYKTFIWINYIVTVNTIAPLNSIFPLY